MRCSSTIALVTGGSEWGPLQSVEVYGTNLSYYLPDLNQGYRYHSCDFIEGDVLICEGISASGYCNYLTSNMTWAMHSNFTQARDGHSSAVMMGRLHVMGGYFFPNSSELLGPEDGLGWKTGQDLATESMLGCALKIDLEVFLII